MALLAMFLSPRWRWCLCIAPASLLLLFLYLSSQTTPTTPGTTAAQSDSPYPQSPASNSARPLWSPVGAGNATLGFEAIVALSPYSSWRTRGLQAAADATGLDITIPPQPPIQTDIVTAFTGLGTEDRAHPNQGSAQAWISHLKLIEHIIQSNLESALVIEDDVDWDVSIREQMVGVAQAVRQLTNAPQSEAEVYPYGRSWDVLWLGSCNEAWDPDVESVYINDSTVCPAESYVGSVEIINSLPEGQRVVFHSRMPICTFAYALSRQGARNVLLDIGAGNDEAFDIALMNGCRERGLNCITIFPELFHHYRPSEKLGGTSLVNSDSKYGNKVEIEVEMGQTDNIVQSARCNALWGKSCLPPRPEEI